VPPLLADGPWVLVGGKAGLWAANPDGSGLRYIYDVAADQLVLGGQHAAFIEETEGYYGAGLTLKMFSLPEGKVRIITDLLSPSTEPQPQDSIPLDGKIAIYTALQADNLAWSPDGTQLAFTSAHEGPSADLYVYSVADNSLTRLSDGPSQAYRLIWTPDGKQIILMGATSFGTGAGYSMAGVWSFCADGTCQRTLYEPNSGDELSLGWVSENTVILYSFRAVSGFHDLRAFNIESGESRVLWPHAFEEAALDPVSGSLLVVVNEYIAAEDPEIDTGIYLVQQDGSVELIPVWDFFSEELRADVAYNAHTAVFLVRMSNEIVTFSPTGELALLVPRILQAPAPVPSPTEDQWVWLDDGALVLNGPEIQIEVLFPSDSHPLWGPDGQSLLFVYEGQLHVRRLDDTSHTIAGSELSGALRWMGP